MSERRARAARRRREQQRASSARPPTTPLPATGPDAATVSAGLLARARSPVGASLLAVGVSALLAAGWWAVSATQGGAPTGGPARPAAVPDIQGGPHLVFQNVARGDDYAKVSVAALDAPEASVATGPVCERVHFAGGQGLCLAAEHGAESVYYAITFGRDFVPRDPIRLGGSPNLAQVSRDGRYGATSVITRQVSEQAEAANQALLLEMATGAVVADLADLSLTRDGADFAAPDAEFWGVTFSRETSDRFYATLRTAGNTYLVEGSIPDRELRVIHQNVSAPSLSPDGTRIAYARLMTNIGPTWRFHVLDLATMSETPLAETKSIDDQMEWLDDGQILYGLGTDVWVTAADGTGTPRLFLGDGLSPAVVR